jgi:hypothetical protein
LLAAAALLAGSAAAAQPAEPDPSRTTAPTSPAGDRISAPELVRDLDRLDPGSPAFRDAVARLGAIRTHTAIRGLAGVLDRTDLTPATRAAAAAAFATQTGRPELARDADARRAWLAEIRGLPRVEVLDRIAERLASDLAAARKTVDEQDRAMVDLYARLYVRTAEPERPTLLVELLNSASPSLRALGYDLASREVLSARALPEQVITAASAGLTSGSARVRTMAAELLAKAAPRRAAPIARKLLPGEADPAAAAALMRVLARAPAADAAPAIVRWLDPRGSASGPDAQMRSAAADAAAEALDALLADRPDLVPTLADDALAALGERSDAELGVADVRLLGRLVPGDNTLDSEDEGGGESEGEDGRRATNDRRAVDRLVRLLRDDRDAIALAAAEALARRAETVRPVIDAAADRPALFGVAAGALATHQPTPAGFDALEALDAPSAEAKTAGRRAFLRSVGPDMALQIARTHASPAAQADILALTLDPSAFVADAPAPRALAMAAVAEALAATLLDLRQPQRALEVVQDVAQPDAAQRLADERLAALVRLGKLDLAAGLAAELDADLAAIVWLDAVRAIADAALARTALDRLSDSLGPSLSEPTRQRIAAMRSALDRPTEPPPEPEGETPREDAPPEPTAEPADG